MAILFLAGCAHGNKVSDNIPGPEPANIKQAPTEEVASPKSKPLVVVHVAGSDETSTISGASPSESNNSQTISEACERVDINLASENDLVTLPGIGPSKADAIVAFRDNNGAFANVDSLTQVRGIGVVTLNKLRPFLLAGSKVAPPSPRKPADTTDAKETQGAKININIGNDEDLMTLRGIGPKTAARIIAYREMHGSFLSLEALTEVKGIGPKTLEKLRAFIEVKVDINQASAEEFAALGFKNGAKIVARRNKRGNFKDPSKLRKVPGTDKKLLNKLRPILR